MLKAAYARLARLARVPVAHPVAADGDRLLSVAVGFGPGSEGDARRLVAKIVRLRV